MKKNLKTILSILLALMIILGSIAQFAFADEVVEPPPPPTTGPTVPPPPIPVVGEPMIGKVVTVSNTITFNRSISTIEELRDYRLNKALKSRSNQYLQMQTSTEATNQLVLYPAKLPATYDYFWVVIDNLDASITSDQLDLEIYESDNMTTNIGLATYVETWGGEDWCSAYIEAEISSQYNNGNGLIADKSYTLVVKKNGSVIYTVDRQASLQPIIDGINPYKIGVGIPYFELKVYGFNLNQFNTGSLSIDLLDEQNNIVATSGTNTLSKGMITTTMTLTDPSRVINGQYYSVRINNSIAPVFYYGSADEISVTNAPFTYKMMWEEQASSYHITAEGFNFNSNLKFKLINLDDPNFVQYPSSQLTLLPSKAYKMECNIDKSLFESGKYYRLFIVDQNGYRIGGSTLFYYAMTGDINFDYQVDINDLVILSLNYGKTGDIDTRADINKDGKVDMLDLAILTSSYGK